MMSLKIRILFIALLLLVLVLIVSMVRKRKLELKYVLVWMGCDIALIIIMVFPRIISFAARLLGIYNPMNAIIFLGILFLLMIVFSLTVALSQATEEIRRLTQIIAIDGEAKPEKCEKRESADRHQAQKEQ